MIEPGHRNRAALSIGTIVLCIYVLACLFVGSFVIWAWVADRLFG